MEKWMGKNTWIGLVVSVMVLMLGLALGALFLSRDILSPEAQSLYLTAMCGCATFLGSFIGARGKGHYLLHALTICAMLYLLLWIFTMSADRSVEFGKDAIRTTTVMWSSSAIASFLVPRKKSKQPRRNSGHQVTKSRKRVVT